MGYKHTGRDIWIPGGLHLSTPVWSQRPSTPWAHHDGMITHPAPDQSWGPKKRQHIKAREKTQSWNFQRPQKRSASFLCPQRATNAQKQPHTLRLTCKYAPFKNNSSRCMNLTPCAHGQISSWGQRDWVVIDWDMTFLFVILQKYSSEILLNFFFFFVEKVHCHLAPTKVTRTHLMS